MGKRKQPTGKITNEDKSTKAYNRRCSHCSSVCLSVLQRFKKASDYGNGENGYLKSATYYSDEWVINFWNSESNHMEEELKQIAEDGFNSIIPGGPMAGIPAVHESAAL